MKKLERLHQCSDHIGSSCLTFDRDIEMNIYSLYSIVKIGLKRFRSTWLS